jgi:hypothetical protein
MFLTELKQPFEILSLQGFYHLSKKGSSRHLTYLSLPAASRLEFWNIDAVVDSLNKLKCIISLQPTVSLKTPLNISV